MAGLDLSNGFDREGGYEYTGGGLGFVPQDTPSPVAPSPEPLPAGPSAAPAAASQTMPAADAASAARPDPYAAIRSTVPQFKDSPIAAIAFLLGNIGRGLQGRPTLVDEAMDRAQKQQALDLQKFEVGIQSASRALPMIQMVPEDQRADFVKKLTAQSPVPGLSDTLLALARMPGASQLVQNMQNLGPKGRQMLLDFSGGTREGLLSAVKDKDLMDRVQRADDMDALTSIRAKMQQINQMIAKSPGAAAEWSRPENRTFANLVQLSVGLHAGNPQVAFTPQELETLGRHEDWQTQFGITPPSVSLKGQQAGAEEAARLPGQMALERDKAGNTLHPALNGKGESVFATQAEILKFGLKPVPSGMNVEIPTEKGPIRIGTGTAGNAPQLAVGQPLPQEAQQSLSQGMRTLDFLDTIDKNIDKSGVVSGQINSALAGLGLGKGAIEFQTARNNLKLQAQALIKGIPSNFDVQTLVETLPDLTTAQAVNKERSSAVRATTKQLISDTLAYFKYTKTVIPDQIVAEAKQRGINVGDIKPYSGQGDPYANAQTTLFAKMPDEALGALDPKNMNADTRAIFIKELKRRQGGG